MSEMIECRQRRASHKARKAKSRRSHAMQTAKMWVGKHLRFNPPLSLSRAAAIALLGPRA